MPTVDSALPAMYETALTGAHRVLLIGGYGCRNAGDEAILSVLVNEPGLASRDLTVISRDPRATERLHNVHAIAAQPAQLLRAITRCDALVVGGGGIFSGYMGRRSMLLPLLTFASTTARKRVLFRALGVYRSTPRPVASMLVRAMERSAFVSVRDRPSVDALRAFGLRRSPILEPDPALRLCAQPYDGEVPARGVGLALRRVRDQATQRRLTSVYAELIARIAAEGRVPVLLPFSHHPSEPVEQDATYLRRLREFANLPSAVLIEDHTPGQILTVVSSLDALVAMRFHAIVFGHLAGTATLALEYDDKCSAFAAEHGISSLSLDEVTVPQLSAALARVLPNEVAA